MFFPQGPKYTLMFMHPVPQNSTAVLQQLQTNSFLPIFNLPQVLAFHICLFSPLLLHIKKYNLYLFLCLCFSQIYLTTDIFLDLICYKLPRL